MARHPLFGVMLALFGTLVLTPDAMLMRLSGMNGFQMVAWRGLWMGSVLIAVWFCISRTRGRDLKLLRSKFGLMIVGCQLFNSTLFSLGIAIAPVAVVLFGVAAVPVFAAVFAWILIGEPTRAATWVAIVLVLIGIGLAVTGGDGGGDVGMTLASALGAAFGLGVAAVLALNFVVLRAQPDLPILLLIGSGALMAGVLGVLVTGPGAMLQGNVWPMAITGAIVLPLSFVSLSVAARFTHAANVSLLMLLETVLGPVWVWLGIGEVPTPRMISGGAIVVISLGLYLIYTGRVQARDQQ